MQIRKSGTRRSPAPSPPAPPTLHFPRGPHCPCPTHRERPAARRSSHAASPSLLRASRAEAGSWVPQPASPRHIPPPQPTREDGGDAQGEGRMRAEGGHSQHTAWLWEDREGQPPGKPQHCQAMDNHGFTLRRVVPAPRRRQLRFSPSCSGRSPFHSRTVPAGT